MAAIITEIIPKQNFELVGEQIGAILTLELANQKVIQPLRLPEAHTVFFERIVSVGHTEEVVIITSFDSFNTLHKTQSDTQAGTNYFIDVYASGAAKGDDSGDKIVAIKLLKYVGLCRYILQTHKYKTLGFAPGFIGGVGVQNIQMFEQQNTPDANFSRMCRINFQVRINESQQLYEGVLLDDNITSVKLEETELGYQYKLKA